MHACSYSSVIGMIMYNFINKNDNRILILAIPARVSQSQYIHNILISSAQL